MTAHFTSLPGCTRLRHATRRRLLAAATGVLCALAGSLLTTSAAAQAAAEGISVSIGGALRDENHAVWQRLVDLAGGPGARYVVLATASGSPEASAASIVANLRRHGAVADALPVAPLLPGIDVEAAVRDPRWIAQVNAAQGVFFSGGAQARLVDTLQPGGQPTPLLAAIRALFARGGVVAGTSSGAAVMSATMFRDAPDVFAALQQPLRDGTEVDRGFGFLPAGVVVDQHFVKRGRIARLLPLMASRGLRLGLGVEEDSAAVVQGTRVEVIGARGVVVVDLHQTQSVATQPPFAVQNARLHWLMPGDRYDLNTRRVQPNEVKGRPVPLPATPAAPGAVPVEPTFFPDVLGDGTLVQAMTRLADRAQPEAIGLAFTRNGALGFEWRFSRTAETRVWEGERGTGIEQVRLDVRPVRMARPLYTEGPPP